MGGSDAPALSDSDAKLVEDLLAGSHRALARVITRIENRAAGYRGIVAALHEHTGGADGSGSPGRPGPGSRRSSTSSRPPTATAATTPSASSPSTLLAVHRRSGTRRPDPNGVERRRHGRVLPVDERPRPARRALDGDRGRREGARRLREGRCHHRDGRRRPERGRRGPHRGHGRGAGPARLRRRRADAEGRHLGDRRRVRRQQGGHGRRGAHPRRARGDGPPAREPDEGTRRGHHGFEVPDHPDDGGGGGGRRGDDEATEGTPKCSGPSRTPARASRS